VDCREVAGRVPGGCPEGAGRRPGGCQKGPGMSPPQRGARRVPGGGQEGAGKLDFVKNLRAICSRWSEKCAYLHRKSELFKNHYFFSCLFCMFLNSQKCCSRAGESSIFTFRSMQNIVFVE
jgi:hypothetical protein